MADELELKQKLFCDEFLIDLNATQAAIRAGYSKNTAKQMGYENLTKPYIQQYIKKRMEDRERRTEITQDMVLKELAKLGFSNIKDYLGYKTEIAMTEINGVNVPNYRVVIDTKDSDDVDGAAISEVSIGKDGTFKFKLYDKVSALKEIGKHLGIADNHNISGELLVNIIDDLEDDDYDEDEEI